MKTRFVVTVLGLLVGGTAFGQESEKTTVTSRTTTVDGGGWDIITELWSFEDATPVKQGQLDLRLTTRWIPEPTTDDDDDVVFQPSLVYGLVDKLEISAGVPIWLGDAGDRSGHEDGNYDTNLGFLWRITDQNGNWPAFALAGHFRAPTGDGSEGIDAELRGVFTNEYDSGIRSHINVFAKSVNGDNDSFGDPEDFQWGAVFGIDGPLFNHDDLRWVADYVHRRAESGGHNIHEAELGWEWHIADCHALGMSGRASLDHAANDPPDYSVNLTYALTLTK